MSPLSPLTSLTLVGMKNLSTDTDTSALTASILRVVFSGISDASEDQTFNLARVGECTFVSPILTLTC